MCYRKMMSICIQTLEKMTRRYVNMIPHIPSIRNVSSASKSCVLSLCLWQLQLISDFTLRWLFAKITCRLFVIKNKYIDYMSNAKGILTTSFLFFLGNRRCTLCRGQTHNGSVWASLGQPNPLSKAWPNSFQDRCRSGRLGLFYKQLWRWICLWRFGSYCE